jgi:hypothetical protein
MHACACYSLCVRTTIELSERHRAALLRLAAERGDKGFSRLVGEVVDAYLSNLGLADGRAGAQRLRGILSEADASDLEARVKVLREHWR